MIIKYYTLKYQTETEKEAAKQRFVRNDHPQLIGEDKEGGMSLYQIGSTEITLMNGENAELGIELRTICENGMKNLVKILQTNDYFDKKFEEEK